MATIKALIIARGGSERIPKKNVKPFFKKLNLLQIKIRQLKELYIDDIVVNSDDEEILNVARTESVTATKRDPYYAKSDTPMKEVYSEIAAHIDCDHILFANCTSPLVSTESLKKMLNMNYLDADSVNTVNWVHKFMFHKTGWPLYDTENQPRSQDMDTFYEINWAAAIVNQRYMMLNGRVVGKNMLPFFIDEKEAIDIDTGTDWKLAQLLYEIRNKQ